MEGIIVIFVLNDSKLSSHMFHISQYINSSNKKIHSYDQMNNMIIDLGSNKCENNNKSTRQLNHLQNQLLKIIVETPENDVLNVDMKLDKRKILTSSIKSSSALFYCPIHAMYNIINPDLKNVSCWSHILLGLIHQFYQNKILKIIFLKNQSMDFMPGLKITLI